MSSSRCGANVATVDGFEEVLAAWCRAESRGDVAALDALIGAEVSGDGPHGLVLGREAWLDRHRRGDVRTVAFAWWCTDVRADDRTAVAMGIQSQVARYRGDDWSGAFPATLVAVRRGGRWTVVNVQVGERTAAEWPPRGRQITHLADVPDGPLRERPDLRTTPAKEQDMSQVIADMAMSLDGYIADPQDGVDHLFGWYFGGDVEVPTATPGVAFRTSESSAEVLRDALQSVGALISGRRNFDLAGGWGGNHPMGVPVFVLTHEPPADWSSDGSSIRFVTDGIESAVAQAKAAAGDKIVGVATPSVTRQCLDAGLLDAIHVNVVPVLLGAGVPFFADLAKAPVALEDPEIVASAGVTHMTYRVRPRTEQ